MEDKLREYRARRRRQQLIDGAKEKLGESKKKIVSFIIPNMFKEMGKEKEEEHLLMENEETIEEENSPPPQRLLGPELESPDDVASETSEVETEEQPEPLKYFVMKWGLYCLVWVTMFAIFLKFQFGAVFFVISVLIGICLNTRTRPRKRGEVSAYSVFNENCVSIDGTLKAEQFEREIRYGAGSVR